MKYKIILLSVILFSAICFPVQAQDVEITASDEVIQLSYLKSSNLLGSGQQDLNFGILLTEDRDIVGSAGLMVPRLLNTIFPNWLTVSAGAKGYFSLLSEPQDADIFSLAPGVEARINASTMGIPMYLIGSFFYAPEILTFGDADSMYDYEIRFELDFSSSVTGLIGYRKLRYKLDRIDDHRNVEDGLIVGVRVGF
jgi:hypothetical protein